ncbi:MAG: ArsA-related P-loop ATPase [Candidatus Microthrix subdominans]|uniref:AAA family ATPase n=1 Tax=Candidatus Neomicrothrix subdominans TaxID=2954438 RepID=A0A936NAZ3_9ACTN|nr:ArsA-related P-loop ATPase [Candidatus Microthrix sp.]MBK9296913.1 AAA family ATPase [Candidatus Microthrix subdominans]MBK6440456.1 AAA family ATPase [Candidatus Microthrix sp.]MBK6971286.1 AAA family ATPase [Candidatus Microthrix sp.]MBK9559066.1 AAA family ATPase [Candidatus Microthrix sp.]MBP9064635.1 AAA family ATPase [Candidatus Microthrix sp.]
MDPTQFFAASRLIIVAGKGGVGKTTASAALSVAAAKCGLSVLLVALDAKTGLSRLLGCEPLDYEPVEVPLPADTPGTLTTRLITPDESLMDYLADHGLKRVAKLMVSSGILEIVSTATPGVRDLLVLGKIRQLEKEGVADLIILDAPAAGHAISFLRSPTGVAEAATSGALHTQATEALAMLGDPSRARVMLVTLPEETPINELVETAFSLEEEVGVMLGPVILNGTWPPLPGLDTPLAEAARRASVDLSAEERVSLASAGAYRTERSELQQELTERLATELPLPHLDLDFVFTNELESDDLRTLADDLLRGIEALDPNWAAL